MYMSPRKTMDPQLSSIVQSAIQQVMAQFLPVQQPEDIETPAIESDSSEEFEPVFCAARIIPNMPEGMNVYTPPVPEEEQDDEPGEHEAPQHGLTFRNPVLDAHGLLTPVSDPECYKAVYFAAFKLLGGYITPYSVEKALYDTGCKSGVEGAGRILRNHIAAVICSGAAGATAGICAPAVDPWALVDGSGDARWIQKGRLPDPTNKPMKAGDGERRMPFMTNLSKLPAFPEKATHKLSIAEHRLERAASRYSNAPVGANKTSLAMREYEECVARAHKCGRAAREAAELNGATPRAAALQYKLAFCLEVRRSRQNPHVGFENVLAHAGIIVSELV
jgi:hypothetical protein